MQNTRFTSIRVYMIQTISCHWRFFSPWDVFKFPCSDSLTCHRIKIRKKGQGWSMSNVLFTIATIFYAVLCYTSLLHRHDGTKSNMYFYFDSNFIRKFLFQIHEHAMYLFYTLHFFFFCKFHTLQFNVYNQNKIYHCHLSFVA